MKSDTKLQPMDTTPTFEEFNAYAIERIKGDKDNPELYTDFIRAKFDAWDLAGWKKEVKGKLVPIKIWKTTLIQALIYRQPNKVQNHTVRATVLKPTGKMAEIENELILSAYRYYIREKELELLHEEVFGFLYDRGIFKAPDEIGANKKPWASWYNKMKFRSKDRALKSLDSKGEQYKADFNRIQDGTSSILWRYGKLECLKVFFKGIKSEQELINKIQ